MECVVHGVTNSLMGLSHFHFQSQLCLVTHTQKNKNSFKQNLREGTGNTKAERAKRGYKVTQISVIAELVEPKGRGDVSGNWMLRVGPLQGNAQIPKEGFVGLVLTSLQAAPWLMLNLAKAVLSTE